MKPYLLNLLVCVLLVVGGLSCRRTEAPDARRVEATPPTAVAVVGGEEVSLETLRSELKRRFRASLEGGLTSEQKFEALERLIQNEAIYAQAKVRGFDQSPEMQARIKSLIIAQFKEREFKPASPAVREQEVETAYQHSGERFAQPAAVRGAAIFLPVPATATAEKKAGFRSRAEALLAEARSAADETAFAKLVAQHSEDQVTRYRGGDLGWLTPGAAENEPLLVEALFALKTPGDVAPLVQTPRGFYIAKLMGKRDAVRKPLTEVREVIRYELSREKAAQAERRFNEAMKTGIDIIVNRELVEAVSLPSSKAVPPKLPEATTAQLR